VRASRRSLNAIEVSRQFPLTGITEKDFQFDLSQSGNYQRMVLGDSVLLEAGASMCPPTCITSNRDSHVELNARPPKQLIRVKVFRGS